MNLDYEDNINLGNKDYDISYSRRSMITEVYEQRNIAITRTLRIPYEDNRTMFSFRKYNSLMIFAVYEHDNAEHLKSLIPDEILRQYNITKDIEMSLVNMYDIITNRFTLTDFVISVVNNSKIFTISNGKLSSYAIKLRENKNIITPLMSENLEVTEYEQNRENLSYLVLLSSDVTRVLNYDEIISCVRDNFDSMSDCSKEIIEKSMTKRVRDNVLVITSDINQL